MVITNTAPPYTPAAIETISPEDFETASVRSAAPSYTSDAPSYHSTVPLNSDPVPPYSPPARLATPAASSSLLNLGDSGSNLSRPQSSSATTGRQEGQQQIGLPPVPTGPRVVEPSLGQFRIPSWSTIHSNPTARHYHSVALRRVAAASNEATTQRLGRIVLDRIEEEERNRSRPLEDPHLVGEEAAARARRERLARENGDEILIREDRRWDWFLSELSARKQPRSRFTMGCR
ncbi:hypothetical protein B0T24DRAFT_428893 [Lasiosphaeria ovina]|uniref:Uncharacterized protein n=1 Tax=Lasiosphaeria ovina TaxID=92902 RepID=A0AAE0JVJ2_9PEZI|nr:hypothetical protein B0T24DRAFT_428893 [Lasiosphaeria ovina]